MCVSRTAASIDVLKAYAGRYPDDKYVFFRLATSHYALGEYDEFVRYSNKALQIDPLYKVVYNHLAYGYHRIGDVEKSIYRLLGS